MDPIMVPAPPRSAYNHNRRVSDLLLSQLKHFQHVEIKSGDLGIDPEIARNIHTEGGAAKYIAAVTTALRSKGAAQPARPTKQPAKLVPLSVDASADKPSPAKGSAAKTVVNTAKANKKTK